MALLRLVYIGPPLEEELNNCLSEQFALISVENTVQARVLFTHARFEACLGWAGTEAAVSEITVLAQAFQTTVIAMLPKDDPSVKAACVKAGIFGFIELRPPFSAVAKRLKSALRNRRLVAEATGEVVSGSLCPKAVEIEHSAPTRGVDEHLEERSSTGQRAIDINIRRSSTRGTVSASALRRLSRSKNSRFYEEGHLDASGEDIQPCKTLDLLLPAFRVIPETLAKSAAHSSVNTLLHKANISMDRRNFSGAQQLFQCILRRDSSFVAAWVSFGVLFAREKNYTEALRCFSTALIHDSKCVEALFNKAIVCASMKRFSRSIELLKQADALCPAPDRIILRALGLVQRRLGKFLQAIDVYTVTETMDKAEEAKEIAEAALPSPTSSERSPASRQSLFGRRLSIVDKAENLFETLDVAGISSNAFSKAGLVTIMPSAVQRALSVYPPERRSTADILLISDELRSFHFFRQFSPEKRVGFCRALLYVGLSEGEVVVKEGAPSEAFYVVLAGGLRVMIKSQSEPVNYLRRGAAFGEMGLVEDKKRSATVIADEPSELFSLRKSDFFRLGLKEFFKEQFEEKRRVIENCGAFSGMNDDWRLQLARTGRLKTFSIGTPLLEQGSTPPGIVIVVKGGCKVFRTVRRDATIRKLYTAAQGRLESGLNRYVYHHSLFERPATAAPKIKSRGLRIDPVRQRMGWIPAGGLEPNKSLRRMQKEVKLLWRSYIRTRKEEGDRSSTILIGKAYPFTMFGNYLLCDCGAAVSPVTVVSETLVQVLVLNVHEMPHTEIPLDVLDYISRKGYFVPADAELRKRQAKLEAWGSQKALVFADMGLQKFAPPPRTEELEGVEW